MNLELPQSTAPSTQEKRTVKQILPPDSFKKYEDLIWREGHKDFTIKDFNELVHYETIIFEHDVPPPPHGFTPQEAFQTFKQIKESLSPNDRQKEWQQIKDFVNSQQLAWARCNTLVQRAIINFPDIPQEKVEEIINNYAVRYSLSQDHSERAKAIIQERYRIRAKAKKVMQALPNKYHLIAQLCNKSLPPDAPLEVILGPISIDFFTTTENVNKLFDKEKDVSNFVANGFASRSVDGIPYTVNSTEGNKWGTLSHERRHQINHLLQDKQYRILDPYIDGMNDPEDIVFYLEVFLTEHLTRNFEKAKDEIIASFENRNFDGVKEKLETLFFVKDGNPYDYFSSIRRGITNLYSQYYEKKLVSTEDVYKTTVYEALDAYSELIRVIPKAPAIEILSNTPLPLWQKTVKRLLSSDFVHDMTDKFGQW